MANVCYEQTDLSVFNVRSKDRDQLEYGPGRYSLWRLRKLLQTAAVMTKLPSKISRIFLTVTPTTC